MRRPGTTRPRVGIERPGIAGLDVAQFPLPANFRVIRQIIVPKAVGPVELDRPYVKPIEAGDTILVDDFQADVASGAYFTVLDVAGAFEVILGSIFSNAVGARLTLDGVVKFNKANVIRGQSSETSSVFYGTFPIPSCRSAVSLKIEGFNAAADTRRCGARIIRRAV